MYIYVSFLIELVQEVPQLDSALVSMRKAAESLHYTIMQQSIPEDELIRTRIKKLLSYLYQCVFQIINSCTECLPNLYIRQLLLEKEEQSYLRQNEEDYAVKLRERLSTCMESMEQAKVRIFFPSLIYLTCAVRMYSVLVIFENMISTDSTSRNRRKRPSWIRKH